MSVDEKDKDEGEGSEAKLEDVARTEHDYLHQRLREDLVVSRRKQNSMNGSGSIRKGTEKVMSDE